MLRSQFRSLANVSTATDAPHSSEPNWEPEDFPVKVVMRKSKWQSDPRLRLDLERLWPSTRRRAPSVPKEKQPDRKPTASALGKRPLRNESSLHLKPVLKPISKTSSLALAKGKPPRAVLNSSTSFYKPERLTPLKGTESSLLDAGQQNKAKYPSRLRLKS